MGFSFYKKKKEKEKNHMLFQIVKNVLCNIIVFYPKSRATATT